MTRRIPTIWLVVLATGLLGAAGDAGASTLDPSHPVWKGPHARAWADALSAWRRDATTKHRPLPATAGLSRRAAAGARVLVVPVLPSDADGAPVSQQELQERWFGDGEGTVRGYWRHVSAGAYEISGRVLPWLSLEGSLAFDYFNVNDGVPANGAAGSRAMARDALEAAARAVDDLRVFDDDGPDGIPGSGDDDGTLDLVVILHPFAPWEVDPTPTGRAIVALQSRLGGEGIGDGTLRADAFVMAGATSPLGVWVHEFGHLLGLEDLYDHSVAGASDTGGADARLGGLGRWSLMASGTWGGGGARPAGLDPWSRRRLEFGDFDVVEDARSVDLAFVDATSAPAVELRPAGDWGFERFLIERRQRRDDAVVDGDLPGSGVLVYRVDDRQGNLGRPNDYVELLQADGRDDIGQGTNDGDAGDAFAGAQTIDGTTLPSTASYQPSAARPSPVISVDAPSGETQRVDIALFDGPWLQLREAKFPLVSETGRADLVLGQRQTWELAFASVGDEAVTGARVDLSLLPGSRPCTISATDDLELAPSAGRWRTTDAIAIEDTTGFTDTRPILVLVTLRVDGLPERSFEVGIPVVRRPGLDAELGLASFVPSVLAAPGDTTAFRPLTITELPRTTSAGWGLRTNGASAYVDDVEVALTSDWLGLDTRRDLEFWSRQDVETSSPGRGWDGGVVEVFRPDRGWRTLEPEARDVVEIWHESRAAVRGRVALGGNAWTWEPARVTLPGDVVPLRVRFRFGSDGDGTARGWEVAGAATESDLPAARLVVRPRIGGDLEVVTTYLGSVDRIDQVRFKVRRPGGSTWTIASSPISVRSDATSVNPINVSAQLDVFEIGLFAELGAGSAGGSTPSLLLGRAGYRRSPEVALPRILTNPALGRIVLEVPIRDEEVELRIVDVRGREVARLTIPAGVSVFEWNGDAESGVRPGSGKYFLLLADDASRALPFVWLN